MRVEVVTSFSPEGAELYGRRCLASLMANWPHPVAVYVDAPLCVSSRPVPGVDVRLTSEIPGWPETRAILPSWRPDAATTGHDEWTRKPTSYLWNAQRFAVKPFVWLDAAARLESGLLVWLDGDTVTTAPVPDALSADVIGDADVAYCGRREMHPETGFVVFRIPDALPLLRWCVEAYRNGWFVHIANGWTDCHVLWAGLELVPVKARDLTSHRHPGEWRSSVDAVALSPIGAYVQHLKGSQRKRELTA